MTIMGQPNDYSDMLKRVFWTTFMSGIVCAFILGAASPHMHRFFESIRIEVDVSFVKGLKALYVLIPLLIAGVSRAIYLHDKISDLFHIRDSFDTRHILYPLAKAIGLPLGKEQKKRISKARRDAMYAVFYPYAGFKDPKIDSQLIRNALDAWGWFWVAVEAVVMFMVTLIIVTVLRQWLFVSICGGVNILLFVFLWYQGSICKRNALREVNAIIAGATRKQEIQDYFRNLVGMRNQ